MVTLLSVCLLFVLGSANAGIPGIVVHDITPSERIVKGYDANEKEFPYMASLRMKPFFTHVCGGSILTKNWILTAAHCCAAVTTESATIQAGSILLNDGGSRHAIEKIKIHEKFQEELQWANDICLIRVSNPFIFTDHVQKITLPPQDWPIHSGDRLNVSGWGYTSPKDELQPCPNRLQKAPYLGLTNDECWKKTNVSMHPGYLCGNGGEQGQGVCYGDSGSPLVKQGVQVGIASWIFLPCGNGLPDFFVRVPHYINWIKEQLGMEASELQFLK